MFTCTQSCLASEPDFIGEQVDYSKEIKSEDISADVSTGVMESKVASVSASSAGSSDGAFANPGSEKLKDSGDDEMDRMKMKEEHVW
ncbi:hypothetical protein COCON_G00217260 [Conger conger]|uniref:Uncharacterized protein n=1 Tax=Conger conger TaxID=82655 RepID=A0A9Q1CYU0_CONCO|nr:hypothetical protein COCON_G00217260 [Conger conger]